MRRRIPEFERSYNPLLFKWLRNLQTKGWYPDPSLPAEKVRSLITENEEGLADRARSMAETYSKQLATWHPERKKVFDPTFRAHARGEYELSVPLFLIQDDGIGFDRLGQNLFYRFVEEGNEKEPDRFEQTKIKRSGGEKDHSPSSIAATLWDLLDPRRHLLP